MRTHSWSVRNKITALLLIPLISLVALWFIAVSVTLGAALTVMTAQTYQDRVRLPGEKLVTELQDERRLSVAFLGGGRTQPQPLVAQRARTDRALSAFRRSASGDGLTGAGSGPTRQRLEELLSTVETLTAARETIDRGELDRAGTMRLYTGMIDAVYRLLVPLADLDGRDLAGQGRAVVAVDRARDALAQEDALLGGVAAAGRFAGTDHIQFVQAVGLHRALQADAAAALPRGDRIAYQDVMKSEAGNRLRALEDRVVAEGRTGAALPVDPGGWRTAYDTVAAQLRDVELNAKRAVAARAEPVEDRIFNRLWVAGVLGLLAVVVSVVFSSWLGRSLVTDMGRLRAAALHLSNRRLPDVVRRLRRGEDVDVAVEAPPLAYGDDELGQVGRAFNEVQRTAVAAAVAEARLRRGISKTFIIIARRAQELLHQQLALLDGMERRISDPADLDDLLRVDHLATRMRRHAEDLAILVGAAPARGWRNPVPMVDVIRGAVSEVKDYARVDTEAVTDLALVGRAVADTIHLLAELIENAASFSPPDGRVRVCGELVPNGFAIEVEDRGMGMSTDAIDEANLRLAKPPEFDPATGTRLGMFVVAHLSAHHGIAVRLRPSPYGGIIAVVLVPPELVVVGPDGPLPAKQSPDNLADTIEQMFELDQPFDRPLDEPFDRPLDADRRQPPVPSGQPAASGMELPRRTRQANLAPQLREPDERPAGDGVAANRTAARSPEQMRTLLSSFQAGTARGRRDGSGEDPQ